MILEPLGIAQEALAGEVGRDAAVVIVEFVAGEAGIALNQLFAASGWRFGCA